MSEYYRYNRHFKPSFLSQKIAIICVVAFLIGQFSPGVEDALSLYLPSLWTGDVWRLLTVGLVHGDFLHIAFNAYALWVLGMIYEPIAGKAGFLLVFFTSLLGGSIAVALFSDAFIPVVGVSGAVFGVFGALLAAIYARTKSVAAMWANPGARQLLILLVLNVVISFSGNISLAGHLGGLVVGLFGGYLLARYRFGTLLPMEKATAGLSAAVLIALTILAVVPIHRPALGIFRSLDVVDIRFSAVSRNPYFAGTQDITIKQLDEALEVLESAPTGRSTEREVALRESVGNFLTAKRQIAILSGGKISADELREDYPAPVRIVQNASPSRTGPLDKLRHPVQ